MAETIVELFEEQVHRSSVGSALCHYRDGVWEEVTWKEWWDASERMAAGLMQRGVDNGDRVCMLASTRAQWMVVDMALAMAGAVSVALNVSTSADELGRVLQDNAVETVVVEDPIQVGKVVEAGNAAETVRQIIYIDDDVLVASRGQSSSEVIRMESLSFPDRWDVLSIDDVRGIGQTALAHDPRYVAGRRRLVDGDSELTIVYTGGVSARPRGVVLTHGNLASQVEALAALQLFSSDDLQLLSLPLAHIFARILYLAAVGYGMTIGIGRGRQQLLEDLGQLQPTLMASVPRIYERLRDEIVERIERRRWRSKLLPLAMEVGKSVSQRLAGNSDVGLLLKWEHRLFSKLLLEDLEELLGGSMRVLISGGAPLDEEVSEFFFASGILLLEGYGLTETSGAVSFNMPDDFRFGSVGKPLPGVDVTIAEDGEILVRGDTVMKRYIEDNDRASRAVDDAGWLHTGDIGRFDGDGFLHLTDRKRELIVTSTGQHVVPGGLEEPLSEHELVAHALAVGDGRPYLAALIALEPDAVLNFVDEHELDGERPVRELTNHRSLLRALRTYIDEVNRRRSHHERIRSFAVIPEFLSVRNGTLTPSGTLRRAEVLERYQSLIEAMYNEESASDLVERVERP